MSFPDPGRPLLGKIEYFNEDFINEQIANHPGIGRDLYERALNCLEYLAELRSCNFDPIFKGGSAVQLLVPDSLQRLSIDIDFATSLQENEITAFLDMVNNQYYNGQCPYSRIGTNLPPHLLLFNIDVPSIISPRQSKIELDFLLHEPGYKIQSVPIKTFFYKSDISVRVPTVEALFGDKMTVLADGTIGKELKEGSALSYAKQLFDLNCLLTYANSMDDIFNAFSSVFEFEREARHRPDMSLNEVLESINAVCQACTLVEYAPTWVQDPRVLSSVQSLKRGIDSLGHYTSTRLKFRGFLASLLGSKLAFLSTLIRLRNEGRVGDLPPISIFQDDDARVQEIVQDSTHLDETIRDLDEFRAEIYFDSRHLKKVNPKALIYWHAAFFPSKALDSLI